MAESLSLLEEPTLSRFAVVPGQTVVITDQSFGLRMEDYEMLTAFLHRHNLRRLRSGWVYEGYAVVLDSGRDAVLFRLFWNGNTMAAY